MRTLKVCCIFLVALVSSFTWLPAPSAQAGTVTYTQTFPLTGYLGGSANFPVASFPKFNLPGACLNSVCIRLDGGVTGEIGIENYDNFPKTVNVYFDATITLQRPDLTTLLQVQPATTTSDNFPAFDGVLDYGGTSGKTYTGVGATAADSLCIVDDNADRALFVGPGMINLPGVAVNTSTQSGANSWSIGIKAYATITVTYAYTDCTVPIEPTTWGRIKSLNN